MLKSAVIVACGDCLTGDGNEDIAVLNQGSNSVSVLLNNGNGTFQPAITTAVLAGAKSIAAGNLGNGHVDLLVVSPTRNEVQALRGNGDGTFQNTSVFLAGNQPSSAAVADFNHDGKLDLAVANTGANFLSLFLGNGNGTFQSPLAVCGPEGSIPVTRRPSLKSILHSDFLFRG
jgi:hypothetical protein